MKRCPTCKRIFTDPNLSFCTEDGTPLATVVDETAEETLVNPSGSDAAGGPSASSEVQPAYQPPGSYVPPSQPAKRKVWPWVLAIVAVVLIVVAGLGIAAAVFVPKMLRAAANENSSNTNVRSYRPNNDNVASANSNTNAGDQNDNDNADQEDLAPPPTSEEEVLSQLTDLENEWTVANINADKKKLNRILADDYVGTTDGKSQGKAEYLKTIERDNSIQKWNFEDLKVKLTGDRATLTGMIRLQVKDREVALNFTDKFVWRDGRWQATGSEVTPIDQGKQ
ncbi:MAG: nuclear transport factor 2 family protein [bacterium]